MNIENRLMTLASKFEDRLQPDDTKEIVDLVGHREWGVSYELFCNLIYEYEIIIGNDEYTEIKLIGEHLKIDESYWIKLKPNSK